MRLSFITRAIIAIAASIAGSYGLAEDIDVFDPAPEISGGLPTLLIVLDTGSSANADVNQSVTCATFSDGTTAVDSTFRTKAAGIEQCAMYNAIAKIPTTGDEATLNIAVMNFNTNNNQMVTGNACGTSGLGGCLIYPATQMNAANKASILNWIRNWDIKKLTTSTSRTAATMQEAWAYYAGKTGISGVDYSSTTPVSNGCGSKYVLYVANAVNSAASPGDGGSYNIANGFNNATAGSTYPNPAATAAQKALIDPSSVNSGVACATYSAPGQNVHDTKGWYLDEWSRYMRQSHAITTYAVGVIDTASCKREYPDLLYSASELNGGGKYFTATNATTLQTAFQAVFAEVQSVNSVFASVSLPISVNPQGSLLNQVFIGMFRPDKNYRPRWAGNLKQYKIGCLNVACTSLGLLDADGQSAISSAGTGFIRECARSEWTLSAGAYDTYWEKNVEGNVDAGDNCPSPSYTSASNNPDGNRVEKGGHAYTALNPSSGIGANPLTRNVFTCANSNCSAGLSSSPASDASRGNISSDASIARWAVGLNNNVADDELEFGSALRMRASAHGDVVHSRPVAINYGTDGNPSVVVFYGANDGMLRAVNGNVDDPQKTTDNITGINNSTVAPGNEIWSFMPPEFYPDVSRLRLNSPPIETPRSKVSIIASPLPEKKAYGFDGVLSGFQGKLLASDTTNKAIIFGGLRRGGRSVYAFDVTNPGSPSLLWRVGCEEGLSNSVACSTGFTGIGQTWSPVTTATTGAYMDGATPKPLVIFGGGYDTCQDSDPVSCGATEKGESVYVVDMRTGSLQKTLSVDAGVIGGVTPVTDRVSGYVKWIYLADLSGNVWRIGGGNNSASSLAGTAPADWSIKKIAVFGGTGVDARKFQFAPDVVDLGSEKYQVILGSGDREKPVLAYASASLVQDQFYSFVDKPTDPSYLTSLASQAGCSDNTALCQKALACITDYTASNTSYPACPNGSKTISDLGSNTVAGWYLAMSTSEKVVTSALTVGNVVTFSTQAPANAASQSANQCIANLGTTKVYNISYKDASAVSSSRFTAVKGGGLPPSPVAGLVQIGSTTVPFLIGGSADSPLQAGSASSGATYSQSKGQVYWQVDK